MQRNLHFFPMKSTFSPFYFQVTTGLLLKVSWVHFSEIQGGLDSEWLTISLGSTCLFLNYTKHIDSKRCLLIVDSILEVLLLRKIGRYQASLRGDRIDNRGLPSQGIPHVNHWIYLKTIIYQSVHIPVLWFHGGRLNSTFQGQVCLILQSTENYITGQTSKRRTCPFSVRNLRM